MKIIQRSLQVGVLWRFLAVPIILYKSIGLICSSFITSMTKEFTWEVIARRSCSPLGLSALPMEWSLEQRRKLAETVIPW